MTALDHDLHCKPPSSPLPSSRAQRVFPDALFGTPFAPILLWILPGWPLAAPAALFAFSAFFLLSAVAFFSFPFAIASLRAASRASGRCERRSLMSSRGAPTMPRCCFTVRRVRFFWVSCRWVRVVSKLGKGERRELDVVWDGYGWKLDRGTGKVPGLPAALGISKDGQSHLIETMSTRTHLCDTLLMLPPE